MMRFFSFSTRMMRFFSFSTTSLHGLSLLAPPKHHGGHGGHGGHAYHNGGATQDLRKRYLAPQIVRVAVAVVV